MEIVLELDPCNTFLVPNGGNRRVGAYSGASIGGCSIAIG